MSYEEKELGSNIRRFRKKRGLTQEDLAKLTGLSTMSIRRYEAGERIVADDTLEKIAKALGTTRNWLTPPDIYPPVDSEIAQQIIDSTLSNRLMKSFNNLTNEGKRKAVERVEELADHPRYQRRDLATAPSSDTTSESLVSEGAAVQKEGVQNAEQQKD